MKDATTLYDKAGCSGFVHRSDGYWWIQDGQLRSMDEAKGKRLERVIHAAYLNQCSAWFSSSIGYRLAFSWHALVAFVHRKVKPKQWRRA